MKVWDKHVDVKTGEVRAIIHYRSWDADAGYKGAGEWGNLHTSIETPFGKVNAKNIEAARTYVRCFQIGEDE